jgi:type IX secretion system PorP/SprF family membrane protein
MKKYIILMALNIIFAGLLKSQQTPNFTLFMMNPFIYNPALAGTANYYQIRSNHRFQWAGFKDAPITNSISAFGPHSKKDMGFGGTIYNDVTGITSRTGLNGVYAYNISVTTDIRLSMGLSAGVLQYKIDGTKVEFEDGLDDPALPHTMISRWIPDASLGVYAYSTNYHVGFSVTQLLNNYVTKRTDILGGEGEIGLNKLKSHFYLMGGYIYTINREWRIEPGFVLGKVTPAPFQLELYTKAIYKNMIWGGVSFRTQDAISIVGGYIHDRKIYFGYAADVAVTDIRGYNFGSHEIFIGFNFDRIKKTSR